MPIANRELLDKASECTVGYMSYLDKKSVREWKRFRELSGITKGQWKRYQKNFYGAGCVVSELSYRKLHVMAEHGKSPHLPTLLKMVEATEGSHEQL